MGKNVRWKPTNASQKLTVPSLADGIRPVNLGHQWNRPARTGNSMPPIST